MSGIEIAAAALKAFPLLLKVVNELFPIFEGSKDWWNFKTVYRDFIGKIEYQFICYKENLLLLILPLDLELDLEDPGCLHVNPESPLWRDLAVRAQLGRRIQAENLDWFLRQLAIINVTLGDIAKLLPKRDDEIHSLEPGTIAHEMNRFKISYSKDREDLLGKLNDTNKGLRDFISAEAIIMNQISSRPRSSPQIRKLQTQAKALYETLQTHLKCSNLGHLHKCAIGAEWKSSVTSGDLPTLKLLLGSPPGWKQRVWSVESRRATSQFIGRKETKEETLAVLVSALNRQEDARIWRQKLIGAAADHQIGIAVVAAGTTAFKPMATDTEDLWRERELKKLKKENRGLLLPSKLSNSSKASQRPMVVESLSSKSKNDKAVVDAAPSITQAPQRQVRFADQPSPRSNKSGDEQQVSQTAITNVCSLFDADSQREDFEYFDFGQDRFLFHRAISIHTATPKISPDKLRDLSGFAGDTPHLSERVRLGLNLILAVLSFGTSGWVPEKLDQKSVFALKNYDSEGKWVCPYFLHESLCATLAHKIHDVEKYSRELFLSLGIALLELTYNTSLEKTQFWPAAESQINEMTRLCVAIKWQETVEQQYGDDLSGPIKRCVRDKFSKDANLEDPAFLQEVIEGVVVPLENFLKGWKTGAR